MMTPKSLNGLRALELRAALFGLTDEMIRRTGLGRSKTISTIGTRVFDEQQLVGLSHLTFIVYPFAIEFALKSLWYVLHEKGSPPSTHHLGKLFQVLAKGATDLAKATRAQDEARSLWKLAQRRKIVSTAHGTLDEFLDTHSNDFKKYRYCGFEGSFQVKTEDYRICLDVILGVLAKRDPETLANLEKQPPAPGKSPR